MQVLAMQVLAMTRRVRPKTATARSNTVDLNVNGNSVHQSINIDAATTGSRQDSVVDWTCMNEDTMVDIFGLLNYRDRAVLACVCKTWCSLASSPPLWKVLDLRFHTLNVDTAVLLAKRCQNLQSLKVRGNTGTCIRELQAEALRHLTWEECSDLDMRELSFNMHTGIIRHEALESLQLSLRRGRGEPDVSSKAVSMVTMCTPNLRRLHLSRVQNLDAETVEGLVKPCPNLTELAFLKCSWFHAGALNSISSLSWGLRFLSVAGSEGLSWSIATTLWSKLPNLIAIDASRTTIYPDDAARLLAAPHLKVLCVLECTMLEDQMLEASPRYDNFVRYLRKSMGLLSRFTNILETMKGLDAQQQQATELRGWVEWVLSNALLQMAETNWPGVDSFWLAQGAAVALSLLESKQEDVQKRGVAALATFLSIHDQNSRNVRAEVIMQRGGIALLLNLAESSQEGVQYESARAISCLCINTEFARVVVMDGGIQVLGTLAQSRSFWVAGEAAGALLSLSAKTEHRGAIAQTGAIEALLDLASKWSSLQGRDQGGVLLRATSALAFLTLDTECRMEFASAGGVDTLVTLLRFCKYKSVQEQAARGLSNLSLDDKIREAIAYAGGVEALVDLARSCCSRSGSRGLLVNTAVALWNLSGSEVISRVIGLEDGVAPLIVLARSNSVSVHKAALGALWSLAYNPDNALLIVKEEGVPVLVDICSSSESKMARFLAVLVLAYLLDGRLDESAAAALVEQGFNVGIYGLAYKEWTSTRGMAIKEINAFLQDFKHRLFLLHGPVSWWSPDVASQAAESMKIEDFSYLLCSEDRLKRFLEMLETGCAVLRDCAVLVLLQLTMPGGIYTNHHVNLLQVMGAKDMLRRVATTELDATTRTKIFARLALHNLEQFSISMEQL